MNTTVRRWNRLAARIREAIFERFSTPYALPPGYRVHGAGTGRDL